MITLRMNSSIKIFYSVALLILLTGMIIRSSQCFWKDAGISDLDFMYSCLKENHPGIYDESNVLLGKRLLELYEESSRMLQRATNEDSIPSILQFFINSLQDGHVYINLEASVKKPQWPGFLIRRSSTEEYRVASCSSDNEYLNNALLLSIDNISPEDYMKTHILPYHGNVNLEASWIMNSHRMLINNHDRLAPQACILLVDGCPIKISIEWQEIDSVDLKQKVNYSVFGETKNIQLSHPVHGWAWITLPTFHQLSSEQIKQMRTIIEQLSDIDDDTIIFDLRGNKGGNSAWAFSILEALYGKEYVDYYSPKKDNRFYRASKNNIEHIEQFLLPYIKNQNVPAEVLKWFEKIVSGMKECFAQNIPLYFHLADETKKPSLAPKPRVKKMVVLVTDYACASAALDFCDIILALPGVIHLGLPTSADTLYMEVATKTLPSKRGTFSFPICIVQRAYRGHNIPYIPHNRFDGDIRDTQELIKYISAVLKK